MTLVLEIEYLTGVAYAAIGPDSDAPDWPAQPDRVFSALVATWAARGERDEECRALEWLEAQPVPRVVASGAFVRTARVSFVPPNDPSSGRSGEPAVMPHLRRRQPRRFPAARPHDPVVRLLWTDADPGDEVLSALEGLAADTAYVGHSASLTRCRFLRLDDSSMGPEGRLPKRCIYRGRFAELQAAFGAGRRPLSGATVKPEVPVDKTPLHSTFGDRWLLLEHVSGEMPDIRAAAVVAKAIRDALLSGYKRIELGDRIPEEVSGHAADGSPTREPHLAIVPLAFTGFAYADGHVLGFGLVPKRGSRILEDPDFLRALRAIAPYEMQVGDAQERRVLHVGKGAQPTRGNGFYIGLSPTVEAGKRSLDAALYVKRARTFATVTPIVLDRHLKEKGEARQEEIAAQIAAACRNIGLPEPEVVIPDKHSAIEGAPSAWPSAKSPEWMRWRLPAALASRALTHAVIRFAEKVQGPVMLGAGRFIGLGLCRPIDQGDGQP